MIKLFAEIDPQLTRCIGLGHNRRDQVDYYDELTIDGDFVLDDIITNDGIRAVIINGDLKVSGDIVNYHEGGSLVVTGQTTANNLIANDCHMHFKGDVLIKNICFARGNNGELIIKRLQAPLLINLHEHATEIGNQDDVEISFNDNDSTAKYTFDTEKLDAILYENAKLLGLHDYDDPNDSYDDEFFVQSIRKDGGKTLLTLLTDNALTAAEAPRGNHLK